ncbi:hypothetical protein EPA93_35305 [Ktedonosporobacter rubrisoli]|uniref:Uncharacterized protein n=1 Tax=Ktedonosporobacter rubrisoli TaxID=2509675 RepID=A0A4P6JZC8_KTERU|nr:hypothetical protein [Ktedonosporobacter rubrisoli]QBD80955.1 hypothetical protein EPA93_35305 [Ktedonosporobacter rubrisoli]
MVRKKLLVGQYIEDCKAELDEILEHVDRASAAQGYPNNLNSLEVQQAADKLLKARYCEVMLERGENYLWTMSACWKTGEFRRTESVMQRAECAALTLPRSCIWIEPEQALATPGGQISAFVFFPWGDKSALSEALRRIHTEYGPLHQALKQAAQKISKARHRWQLLAIKPESAAPWTLLYSHNPITQRGLWSSSSSHLCHHAINDILAKRIPSVYGGLCAQCQSRLTFYATWLESALALLSAFQQKWEQQEPEIVCEPFTQSFADPILEQPQQEPDMHCYYIMR